MHRRTCFNPNITFYKPAGVPGRELEEVLIRKDEAEALKLCDLEGLKQEEAAIKMNISQPTLFRIINGARNKIADAIINGKAIQIEK